MRSMQNVGRGIRTALGAIGVGLSLGATVMYLKNAAAAAIQFGDDIAKASAKTGVAAGVFSELAYAAKQSDVPIQALGVAFRKMQVAVSEAGSGAKAAQESFAALGIEFGTFRRLSPDKQFEVIAEQISRLKDPADRARAAVDLFGRSGSDLLPMMMDGAKGIRALREEAERVGASLTDQQVAALAGADDAIKRLDSAWAGLARTLSSLVAPALTSIANQMTDFISGSQEAMIRRQIALLQKFQGRGGLIVGAGPHVPSGIYNPAEIEAKIKELRRVLAPGTPAKGPTVSGATTSEPPGYKPPVDTAGLARAAAEREKLLKDMRDREADLVKSGLDLMKELEPAIDGITRKFEEQKATLLALAEAYPNLREQAMDALGTAAVIAEDAKDRLKENNVEIERHNQLMAEYQELLVSVRTPAEEWAATVERLTEILKESGDMETFKRALEAAGKTYEDASRQLDTMSVFAEQAARNIQDSFAAFLFDPFKEGLKGMLSGFVDMLRSMVANLIAQQALMAFFNWAAGASTGAMSSFFGSMATSVAGTRASGGPVTSGSAYLVGERGPEMLVMGNRGGSIIPNGGGGMAFTYNIDARGADAERIMAVLPPLLKRNKEQTISELLKMQRQGRFA